MIDLFTFDLEGMRFFNRTMHSPAMDVLMHVFSLLGLGGVQGALALGFTKTKAKQHYATATILAIIVAGLPFAQLTKQIVQRDRPSNLAWVEPQEAWLARSFPSGHTATSFAIATMICLCRGKELRPLEAVMWFTLAALIGISRMYRGVHWPTDVIAGAFAGIAAAILLAGLGLTQPDNKVHNWFLRMFQPKKKIAANSAT